MELMNYLSPFGELPMSIRLKKINKHIFGKDVIELNTNNKLHDYLIDPLRVIFLKVLTSDFETHKINAGDLIVIERSPLRIDGLSVVRINGEILIKDLEHDKNFNTVIKHSNEEFEFFGLITYAIESDEEDFMEMLGEELFKVN